VLFRSPLDPKTIGQSIAKGEAWSRFMSVLTKGSYESSVSIFDKLPRLVSFSRVDDYPLVVYVSASKNDMLQPWVFHTAILGGVAALVSLVSLLAGAALLHAMNASRVASAIIQSSDDAIVGKSLDGTITSWNPGAERIFGYTAKEMLGQPILRLLPHNRVHEESLIMEKIKNGQGVDHFETVRMRKDGSPINVSVTISPSVMNLAN
jgi:PAS domain S-box-containing protein